MTTSSYDQLPYSSLAFPQTHPDRLATIARIFALTPPDVAACRVLELGCASGGNLIPIAFALPGSQFVGIDLSARQVDDAQEAIAGLGLRNTRILHASILDIDDEWGEFDYIICHGVFSWVDDEVQDKILAIASRNLSPHGVAYVSYNTYPGWHLRESVRQMMRYHAAQFSDPHEQVEQARALVSFLASASTDAGPYHQLLTGEAERLGRSPDSYIYHEHLERSNAPLYFHQFIERAERVGLQYLSEAALSEMLTSHFPARVAATLERISPDLLHLEQYMDFLRNRQFRQTLLCHREAAPRRTLRAEVLHDLLLSSAAAVHDASPDLSSDVAVTFTIGSKRAQVATPSTKAALLVLIDEWPRTIRVDDLIERAMKRAAPFLSRMSREEAQRAMLEELFGAVMHGLIDAHTQPPLCTNRLSDAPCAHPVAAFQVRSGPLVVNAHHTMFELDALSAEVLKLADGRRRRDDMIDAFIQQFDGGGLTLEHDGAPITDREAAKAMLSERVDRALSTLLRSGLFVS